jgi:hypothetical protein
LLDDLSENRLRVVTLDRPPCTRPDYLRASGDAMPFRDRCFDAAVASDVLEHIPATNRRAFLAEMTRVVRGWVLVGGPFRSPETEAAERAIDNLTRSLTGQSNPWLREHIDCGLPDLGETRATLSDLGFSTVVVPNGSLFGWFLMKSLELAYHAVPDAFERFETLNDLYIRNWADSDHSRPTYRHLVIGHRHPESLRNLLDNPLEIPGIEYFGPDAAIPSSDTIHTHRIAAVATEFERFVELCRRHREQFPGRIEESYVERLESIVAAQEERRTAEEKERAELERRLQTYESSRLVRLWRALRWRKTE